MIEVDVQQLNVGMTTRSRDRGASGPETGRRPRVLVLARSYPNDVLPRLGLWTERLTVELGRRNDVHVVSPVPYFPPLPQIGPLRQYVRFRDVLRRERRNGIDIERPRFLVGPGYSLHALEADAYARGIGRVVERLHADSPFDLVHAHFIYPDGVVAQRLAQRWGVPFIVSEHAPWFPWLERRRVRRLAIPAAREAAAVVAVSSSVRDTIARYAGNIVPVDVVPIGVDNSVFTPGPQLHRRRRDQILYVGRPGFGKGVDVLLRAMKFIVGRHSSARLLLVGDGYYRQMRKEGERLRGLASELGLDRHIEFANGRPPTEIARLMREAPVLVLPSRAESFGAVLVEALACGTPVVATRCGGPEDIVTDEVGRLVPSEDPKALAEALLEVLLHPQAFAPQRLREYAITRYSWEVVAARYHALYRESLDVRRNGS
jgi:teichuronic acid biosynthesis glycosyltransferase TuaC